jgi:hypothetical protein
MAGNTAPRGNEWLRRGLRPSEPAAPYETPSFASDALEGVGLDKALSLAGALEDAEILRKFEMGK